MILLIKKLLKKLFSYKFIHPIVNERLSNAIDDKRNSRIKLQNEEIKKYNDILNGYLKTYFSKTYNSADDMSFTYKLINKEWKQLCVKVNSTNKLINLNKTSFEKQVKSVINKVNETKKKTK